MTKTNNNDNSNDNSNNNTHNNGVAIKEDKKRLK